MMLEAMLVVIIKNKNKPGFGANQGPSGSHSWWFDRDSRYNVYQSGLMALVNV